MKNDLGNIVVRVKHLEDAVFGVQRAVSKKVTTPSSFTGPKGGALLLISSGFFSKKKTAAEVAEKLREQGYQYRTTVVQTALRRMSTVRGPLVALTEARVKCYVIRK
jgi:hypothetical protein